MSIRTNALKVQAFAGALYGLQVGTTTMAQVNADITSGGFTNTMNSYYTSSFGGVENATVAASIAANLGLTGDALASGTAYITAQLNATAANSRGALISTILDQFAGLTADATFGAAAIAYNAKVDTALAYTGSANVAIGSTVSQGAVFTLTTGADNFTGGAANDTFNAAETTAATLSVGDSIDGGAGDDTFNVTQTAAITLPVGLTVKNVETANLLSGTTATSINTTGWTGLTALNVTAPTAITATAAATTAVAVTGSAATGAVIVNGGSTVAVATTGANGGTINIGGTTASAGAVTVASTGTSAGGTTGNGITVKGGTTVDITQVGGNAVNTTNTSGAVTVTGTAATTAVTVSATKIATASATVAGQVANTVSITDVNNQSTTAAGTITTATVSNYTSLGFNGNALSTLSVTGGSGNIVIDNSGLTTATNKTLNLTVNGLTGGTLDDADIYTTLNITGTGAAATLANITFGATTALNVDGTTAVTATNNAGLSALTSVTSTNTAGLTLGSAIGTGVTFSGGTGNDTVTIGVTTKAITMGAGNDVVTTTGIVGTGGSVAAGDGVDTVVMTSAEAAVADNSATFNTKFTGFETLRLSNALAATTTLDLAGINSVTTVELAAGGAAADSILSNLASGGTVKLTADSTAFNVAVTNATFNPADVLNLNLSKAAVLAAGVVTAAGVETINIAAPDATAAGGAAVIHTATLTAAGATSIVVSGNNGLNLTATGSVAVTNFDASAVIGNGTADTAANLAVTYVSVNTTAANAVTIKGGAGNDSLTGVGNVDTITGGEGADTITGGAGNDVIVLAETTAAVDKFVFSGSTTVALTLAANGVDSITGFGATDTLNILALAGGQALTATGLTTASTAAAQGALADLTVAILDVSGAAASLTTGGTLAVTDFTNMTQVSAFLSERYTTTNDADQENVIVWNVGTTSYIYAIDSIAAGTTAISASEIALVGVVAQGAALATANLVYA
jgi:S-layer protein